MVLSSRELVTPPVTKSTTATQKEKATNMKTKPVLGNSPFHGTSHTTNLNYRVVNAFVDAWCEDNLKIMTDDVIDRVETLIAMLVPKEHLEVISMYGMTAGDDIGDLIRRKLGHPYSSESLVMRVVNSVNKAAREKKLEQGIMALSSDTTGCLDADVAQIAETMKTHVKALESYKRAFFMGREASYNEMSREKLDKMFPEFEGAFIRGKKTRAGRR
jgi:hypothetical protein